MNLLITTTEDSARALEQKVWRYAVNNQNAEGGSWCQVRTDGKQFSILFDNSIIGALSDDDLCTIRNKDGTVASYANVIQGESKTIDEKGNVTGTWEIVLPPVPPKLP